MEFCVTSLLSFKLAGKKRGEDNLAVGLYSQLVGRQQTTVWNETHEALIGRQCRNPQSFILASKLFHLLDGNHQLT